MKQKSEGILNGMFQKRLDENVNEFVKTVLSKSEKEIIAMNEKMAVVEYVHGKLIHYQYFSDDDIEIFLMFHSPLMVISDIVFKEWNGKYFVTARFDEIISEFIEHYTKYFNEYLLESYCYTGNKQEKKDDEKKLHTENTEEENNDLSSLITNYAIASFELFLKIYESMNQYSQQSGLEKEDVK